MARERTGGVIGPLVAAVALAEVAAQVLRPRSGVLDAAPAEVGAHFDAAEVARARRYGRGQLALGLAGAGAEGALLVWLVRRDRRRADRPAADLATVAARGATLSVVLAAAPLPFAAMMRRRALDAGLATQSWAGWANDVLRSGALASGFSAAGAVIVAASMRRFGGRWWAPTAAGSVGVAAVVTLAGPVLLEPIFNDFTPLPDGELRRDVLALAQQAGVRVGEVFAVDASRRTTAANAYVNGLGATRRIVLYDTLLESFSPEEARTVVAHELAHVALPRRAAPARVRRAVAPAGTRAVARLAERFEGRSTPGLPALALAGGVVSSAIGVIARQLSRAIERRADAFSLSLTDAPDALSSFERRITRQNLADPDPPRWLTRLIGTHPSIVERIGIANAYAAGARPTRRDLPSCPRTRAGS